ncbi:hypothetical protein QQ045_031570 [Rhodiola kirilowii]
MVESSYAGNWVLRRGGLLSRRLSRRRRAAATRTTWLRFGTIERAVVDLRWDTEATGCEAHSVGFGRGFEDVLFEDEGGLSSVFG